MEILGCQYPVLLLVAAIISGSSVRAINYRLTVQQPVTLVAPSTVTRMNGTCCNPNDLSDCNFCPDDSSIDFNVFVCFRQGGHVGISDENNCPLGGATFIPNRPPEPVSHLTPRVEASLLPADFQGSLQLFGKITATFNNQETDLDIAWVFRKEISADGVFRRICRLSQKQIAILCVNVKVTCNIDTVSPNCLAQTQQTTVAMSETSETTATSTPAVSDLTTTTVDEFTTEQTGSITTRPSTVLIPTTSVTDSNVVGQAIESSSISGVSIVIGLFIGAAITAVAVVVIYSSILIACNKKRQKASNTKFAPSNDAFEIRANPNCYNHTTAPSNDAFEIQANPTYASTLENPKDDPPLYQEIPAALKHTHEKEEEEDDYI